MVDKQSIQIEDIVVDVINKRFKINDWRSIERFEWKKGENYTIIEDNTKVNNIVIG